MNCGEFIGELMRARDILHIEHWQSKHWGEHISLEEIYEDLVERMDAVAELRLARGPVDISVEAIPESINIIAYLEDDLVPLIDKAKKRMDDKGFNDISAELDGIKSTVMRGLYKIKNLTKTTKRKKKIDASEDAIAEITEEPKMTISVGILYKRGKKSNSGGKLIIKK